ncbi:MAG: glycosyltransferase family 2 protein [Actinobacteria bacterium]|nr:glycosyltransferase family 2 protein [Actinomycetota bacterium]
MGAMIMSNATVSVLVPCFNSEETIGRFLDSIIAQSYSPLEVIVVDDGSTDSTAAILEYYEKLMVQSGISFTHIRQANKGIGGAINTGLKSVTGEYLTWLNSDDVCNPEYIETLASFLEVHREYAAVRSDAYLLEAENRSVVLGKLADNVRDRHKERLFESAVMEEDYHFGHWMVRVDELDRRNPSREIYPSRQGHNWQLTLPLFYDSRVAFIDRPLYAIAVDGDSVSRAPSKNLTAALDQSREHEKILTVVLSQMNIPEQAKWLDEVAVKYARRRMHIGLRFHDRTVVRSEFACLKQRGQISARDLIVRLRGEVGVVDSLLSSRFATPVRGFGRWVRMTRR